MHRDSNLTYEIAIINGNLTKKTDAGFTIDKLTDGQWAAFDYDTNTVFDLDQLDKVPKRFYIAYREADGVHFLGEPYLERDGLIKGFKQDPVAGVPKIFEIKDFESTCNLEYAIRLDFSNALIARRQGYAYFTHTVSTRSRCCKDCSSGEAGDPNLLAFDLYKQFVLNPQIPVQVDLKDDDVTGAPLSVKPVLAEKLAEIEGKLTGATYANATKPSNPKKRVKLVISALPVGKVNAPSVINPQYIAPRGTDLRIGLLGGFSCSQTKVSLTQEQKVSQGDGYDIRQLEYVAGGWSGNPGIIRMGNEMPYSIVYRSDVNATYTQYTFRQEHLSQTGWSESMNKSDVILAVKTGSNGNTIGDALLKIARG